MPRSYSWGRCQNSEWLRSYGRLGAGDHRARVDALIDLVQRAGEAGLAGDQRVHGEPQDPRARGGPGMDVEEAQGRNGQDLVLEDEVEPHGQDQVRLEVPEQRVAVTGVDVLDVVELDIELAGEVVEGQQLPGGVLGGGRGVGRRRGR